MDRSLTIVLALALAPAACVTAPGGGSATTEGVIEPPEPDTYEPGLRKDGEQGVFSFALTSEPGPPELGVNTWTVVITMAGAPVEGANVDVDIENFDTGSGPGSTAFVTEEGGGSYRVHPVDFDAPGLWDTAVTVESSEGRDTVHFAFEIAG